MYIVFSIYHRETKSPKDQSYICSFDWDNTPDGSIVKPNVMLADGRVSGLSKLRDKLWCGVGTGIKTYDLKKKKFLDTFITHQLINQTHSLHVTNDRIYLTSTGLDLLLIFNYKGKLLSHWHPNHGVKINHLENKDYRFIDYKETGQNIHHLNHVTSNDKFIFINCGKTGTIYQLDHKFKILQEKKLETEDSNAYITHDGIIYNDWLILTEANGFIWKWNFKTGKTVKIKISTAWLRGLSIYNNTYLIGITSPEAGIRSSILQTDFKGNKIKLICLDCPFDPPMVYSVIPHFENALI